MTVNKLKYRNAAVALVLACLLPSCAAVAQQQADRELPEYGSMDDALRAVDKVIGCEENPTTNPIINKALDLDGHKAEYAVCSGHVQIDWFENEEARNADYQVYADTTQPVFIVAGKNWLVVDNSEALQEPPSGKDLERLAEELGAEFSALNGPKS
ncbi:hypothetical protein [Paenarthrobacter nitroguajacolicus]|uniref:hypothetical protein n=1 Tax=Paenarthrobacter nitroguajacolicus TaxID=211146 RepID=UPI0040541772